MATENLGKQWLTALCNQTPAEWSTVEVQCSYQYSSRPILMETRLNDVWSTQNKLCRPPQYAPAPSKW